MDCWRLFLYIGHLCPNCSEQCQTVHGKPCSLAQTLIFIDPFALHRRLRQTWCNALNDAEAHCRQLFTSSDWKRISTAPESQSKKGKGRISTVPELSDVIVHRHTNKAGGDPVYRMLLDVAVGDENVSLEPWNAVLSTPELRQEWDPAVEEARLLEMFDHKTRISKTNFTLGWPAK
jgi:hypothetical protein